MFTLYNSEVEGGVYLIQQWRGGRCLRNTTVGRKEVFTLYNSEVEGGVYFIQQ